MEILHYPVLHKEVLEALVIDPEKESRLIDCTTGEIIGVPLYVRLKLWFSVPGD